MAIRVGISFKETIEEIELYKFLKEKSKLIGESAYVKVLIMKEMEKEKTLSKEG